MPIVYKVIGDHMRDIRRSKKQTQSEIAEFLNISVKHYGHIERGARPASLEMLGRFCEYYEVCLEELIAGSLSDVSCRVRPPKEQIEHINRMLNSCSEKTVALISEIIETIIRNNRE